MNKIVLTGRLTKDGEVRTTQSNQKVYSNSIAVQRNFKNKDGNYDTDFFDFSYWNLSDNFAQYLKKGKMILLEGKLQTRTYENDRKEKRKITEVIAENIELLSFEKKEQIEEVNEFDTMHTKIDYKENEVILEDDDLPF